MVAIVDINLNLVLPERAVHLCPGIQRTELNVECLDLARLHHDAVAREEPSFFGVHQL